MINLYINLFTKTFIYNLLLLNSKMGLEKILSKGKELFVIGLASTVFALAPGCGGGSGGGGSSGGGTPAIYQCNDSADNDGDTLVDYPSDPGCSSRTDNSESNPSGNQAPVALASFLYSNPDNSYHPTYVHPGDAAVFDGTNSYDPDSSPNALTYNWSLILKPICSALTSSNINPNQDSNIVGINPDCIGNYTLELTVSDGLDTGLDTVVQSVVDNATPTTPNISPADNPGGWEGDTILFTASGSTDSDGPSPTYNIINSNLPNDPDISFNQNTGAFNWPTDCNDSGSYTLDDVARDDDNAISVPHTVTITIFEVPTCSVPTN